MSIVIAVVILFVLVLAYVRTAQWWEDRRRTRFVFDDREAYLFLKLDRPLSDAESGLLSMMALREALLLKVARAGQPRVLVQLSALRLANQRAFWLLVGGLGPLLVNENVKLAVVCGRWTSAAKHFRKQNILKTFPSVREGERYLRSAEPRQTVPLDRERVDALLAPKRRRRAA
jgi:hypothetical protein